MPSLELIPFSLSISLHYFGFSIYCHKVFPTWQGCQKHMISKRHTKLRYESGIDLEDLTVFYDFSEADNAFLQSVGVAARGGEGGGNIDMVAADDNNGEVVEDDGDEDWEDVSDDEEMVQAAEPDGADDDDDDDLYDAYEEQLAQFGFDVTELGELVLPNGRVVGHRALSRYYRQRVPSRNESTAVVAARRAAGERLYNGQVYNIHGSEENALALARAGIQPATASGRAGKGILVKGAGGVYTSLSIYRYRAVLRKQRRDDVKGKRLSDKTKQNINKMNKKHNKRKDEEGVAGR
jgi:pre-60S factor REI1